MPHTLKIVCRLELTETGYTITSSDIPVAVLHKISDTHDTTSQLEIFHPRLLDHVRYDPRWWGFEKIRFCRLQSGPWITPHELEHLGTRLVIQGLHLQTIHASPLFTFEKTPISKNPTQPHGRAVVYLGYYLPNDTTTIQNLHDALCAMGITHALLTFITCPTTTGPISLNYSMTNDFFNLSPENQQILVNPTNPYVIGVSFGGAFDMVTPLNSLFEDGAYYGGTDGIQKLATDLAWACSPPVCSTYPCSFSYMIQKGDSCSSIAQHFDLTVDELLDANPTLQCDPLTETVTYTVQQGDYCYLIAQNYGISVDQLLALNPGLNCNTLTVGQQIQVPHYIVIPGSASQSCTSYTVQSGDTCATIAKNAQVSLHDLFCANPGLNCQTLQVGQHINIPHTTIPFPPTPPADGPFFTYIDLDLEHIVASSPDVAQQFVDNVGTLCQNLRKVGFHEISHAPQPPYFTDSYLNIYMTLYEQYKESFDFYNIQYYNNGPSQTFDQIFIESDETTTPQTAVLQLIQRGLDPSYIVVGKPSEPSQGTAGGYVDLPTLSSFFQQAYTTPSLQQWCSSGGAMIYYFSTTSIPVSQHIFQYLPDYIQNTYSFVKRQLTDDTTMDEAVKQFFISLVSTPCLTS